MKLTKENPEDLCRATRKTLRLERGDGVGSDLKVVNSAVVQTLKSTDAKFMRTWWVHTMKDEDVRCRFVGQKFAAGGPRTDIFASTPPLFL